MDKTTGTTKPTQNGNEIKAEMSRQKNETMGKENHEMHEIHESELN
jgi:hypothetical protein